MATTIDRTINQFDLLDRYSSKLDAMSRKTESFGRVVKMAQTAAIHFGVAAAGAMGAAIVKLGTDAVQTASQFEQFAVTLEVLTGGADKAAKKLDFIKRLAIPSTFTFQELAAAGTQLEAFRVPLEKALPLIAKLGAAFPNKELGDFVQLFGRLASGDFPDLEALSGAGLSKLDFMKQGIKFDANGSLLSSSKTTMDALERIINQRYGTILERISSTTASKLATVGDKWQEVMRKIGDAMVRYVNPALDRLSTWLDKMSKDDNFEKFLKNIAKNFVKFVGILFGILGSLLLVVALLKFAMKDVLGGVIATFGAIASFAGGMKAVTELAQFFKSLEVGKGAAGGIDVPTAPPGTEFPDNPALATLNDIEKNTGMTAENTRPMIDFKKYALGGGDIAAQGIQAIDRYRGSGGRGGMNITIAGGRGKFEQWAAELVRDGIEEWELRKSGRV